MCFRLWVFIIFISVHKLVLSSFIDAKNNAAKKTLKRVEEEARDVSVNNKQKEKQT